MLRRLLSRSFWPSPAGGCIASVAGQARSFRKALSGWSVIGRYRQFRRWDIRGHQRVEAPGISGRCLPVAVLPARRRIPTDML